MYINLIYIWVSIYYVMLYNKILVKCINYKISYV